MKNLVAPGVSQFNRLGIDCFGNQITGAVNGTIVLAETDNTYPSGLAYIGIGNSGGAADNLFGVFDNLTVVDQGGDFAEPTLAAACWPVRFPATSPSRPATIAVNGGVNTADFFATATFAVPSQC